MTQHKIIGLLACVLLVLAACTGGDTDSPDSGDDNDTVEQATATPFPTFEFVAPTNPPVFNQSAEGTDAPDDAVEIAALDPEKVERGLGRYEALECGSCHGVDGAGTDDVVGFTEFALPEEDFITFMRSGGEIGNAHQYSTNRLSENGARNLYEYLLSLSRDE